MGCALIYEAIQGSSGGQVPSLQQLLQADDAPSDLADLRAGLQEVREASLGAG